MRGKAREEGGGQGRPRWECVRESQGGGREPGSSREGACEGVAGRERSGDRGREGGRVLGRAREGRRAQGRAFAPSLPPSLALSHALREGRRA
jgi:hypothetical protein